MGKLSIMMLIIIAGSVYVFISIPVLFGHMLITIIMFVNKNVIIVMCPELYTS